MRPPLRFIWATAILLSASAAGTGAQEERVSNKPSHGASITGLRAAQGGSRLASASADGTIKLWRTDSPSESPRILSDFPAWTHEAVLHPDAAWLAAALAGGEIRVWKLPERHLVQILRPQGGETLCLAVSPDGRLLAAGGSQGEISLWSLPGGDLLKHIEAAHEAAVWDLEFSPDGELLASGSEDETLRFWTSQGEAVKRIDKFEGPVAALAFQPGYSDRVAAASWQGRISRLELRESDGSRKGKPDQVLSRVRTLTFSPDGQRLAAGGDGASLVLWEMDAWPRSNSFYFQGRGLQSLSFAPGGQLLAGGGREYLRFWDSRTGKLLSEVHHPEVGSFTSVAFLPDGKRLMTASWGALDGASVKIRGPQRGQSVDLHPPAWSFQALALAERAPDTLPDTNTAEPAGGPEAKAADLQQSNPSSDSETNSQTPGKVPLEEALLASVGAGGTVQVWKQDRLLAAPEAPAPVLALDLSPKSEMLAAALQNGSVAAWKHERDRLAPAWTRSLHLGAATALRFLPSGRRLAVGGRDGFLHLLEADDGASVWEIRNDFSITALDIDRTGTRLAWTTVEPGVAWVDLGSEDGEPGQLHTIDPAQDGLLGLALGPQGRLLALAGTSSLQLWRLPSGASLQQELGHNRTNPNKSTSLEESTPRDSTSPPRQSEQQSRNNALTSVPTEESHPLGSKAQLLASRPGQYTALAFLADGSLAAASDEGRIEILDAASLQLVVTLQDWSQPVLLAQVEAQPVGRLDKAALSPVRLSAPEWCGDDQDGRCLTRQGMLLLRLQGPDFENGARFDRHRDGIRVRHSGFVDRGGARLLPQGLVLNVLPGHDLAAGDHVLIDRLALSREARPFRPSLRQAWRWNEEWEEWVRSSLDMAMQEFPLLESKLEVQAQALAPGSLWLAESRQVVAIPFDQGDGVKGGEAQASKAQDNEAQGDQVPSARKPPLAASDRSPDPSQDSNPAQSTSSAPPRSPDVLAENARPVSSDSLAASSPTAALDRAATPTFTTSVDLVNVLVTVRDSEGRYVTGLGRDDFLLTEDDQPQTITYFSSDDEAPPLSLVVVVDTSESVEEKLSFERRAAIEFLRSLMNRSEDAAAVVEFGSTVKLVCDFSHRLDRLEHALEGVYVDGRTRLFDGIWLAIEDLLAQRKGRRIIVLVSDGNDTNSRLNAREAIRQAQDNEVLIFGIGVRAPGEDSDFDQIRRLAESTGGLFFNSRADLERLREAFEAIRQAIAAQYSLGYAPRASSSASFRSLEITIPARPRLGVTHRPGYHYAPPR